MVSVNKPTAIAMTMLRWTKNNPVKNTKKHRYIGFLLNLYTPSVTSLSGFFVSMPILSESPKLIRDSAKPMLAVTHKKIPNHPGMVLSQNGRSNIAGIGNPSALAADEYARKSIISTSR